PTNIAARRASSRSLIDPRRSPVIPPPSLRPDHLVRPGDHSSTCGQNNNDRQELATPAEAKRLSRRSAIVGLAAETADLRQGTWSERPLDLAAAPAVELRHGLDARDRAVRRAALAGEVLAAEIG